MRQPPNRNPGRKLRWQGRAEGAELRLFVPAGSAWAASPLGERGRRAASQRLVFLARWFARALWSLSSVSAHSKLLTVNTEGGVPATEEATGKQLWAVVAFPGVTQRWLPAQALCGARLGGMGRRKGGGWASGDLGVRKLVPVFCWVRSLGARTTEEEVQQLRWERGPRARRDETPQCR